MSLPDAIPCPFCGGTVELDADPAASWPYIECENDDCIINAVEFTRAIPLGELREMWNRRAPPAPGRLPQRAEP